MQTTSTKKVIIILCLALISLITNASQPKKNILADSLFRANEYTNAIKLYEQQIDSLQDFVNPSVFLKCAFITERFGDTPKAIYYLSRYNQFFPSVVVTERISKLANESGFDGYDKNDLDTILTFIAANYFYIIAMFLLVGISMYYILFYKFFRNQRFLKRHSLLLVFYLVGMLFIVNTPFQLKNVIVSVPKAELRKEPSGASVPVRTVRAGDRLLHLGNTDVWSRVRFEKEVYFINSNNCWTLE